MTSIALLKSFLLVFASMIAILNPASTAPIFLGLTRGASVATRRMLARRIATNVFVLMTGSMLIGSFVLDFFGISLPIVRVGGGLVVAMYGWNLLHARPDSESEATQVCVEGYSYEQGVKQAFYPLTFPVSCGPGSMATAITLGVSLHNHAAPRAAMHAGAGILAMAAVGVLIYLAFRYAELLLRPLGEVGKDIFVRMSAFIMLCVGVQIMWTGASQLIRSELLGG